MKGKKTEASAGTEGQKTAKKSPLDVDSGTDSAESSKTATPDSAIGISKEKEQIKGTKINMLFLHTDSVKYNADMH